MAYFNDPQEDELLEQQNGQQAQATGPQGATLQGSGSAPGGAPPAATPATPDKGSNFVGINQYLNANKSQAGKLGDQASGVITNSANDARSSLDSLNNSFNQKVGTAASIDPNILGKVGEAEKLGDDEKNQIKSAYNAQYQGPNSLTDLSDEYNAAGQKISTAKKNVESAGTEEGRQGLITQINAKPRTQGITNFDSVLLQAGGGREKLNQAASANKDVAGDVLSQNNLLAQQKASDIKTQTDATRTATQDAVTGATTNFNKQFDANDPTSKLSQQIAQALKANNTVAQDLGNDAYSLDQGTMDLFGLSGGQRSYGINPLDYFQQGDTSKINAESVASQEDYARAAALADLSGGQSYLKQDQIGNAGTAGNYAGKIDKDGLMAAINEKGAGYEKPLNNKLNVTDFVTKTGLSGDNFTMKNPKYTGPNKGQPEMVQGNLTDYVSKQGQIYKVQIPSGSLENASPKQLQEQWMPQIQKLIDADPKGPAAQAFLRPMLDYIKNQVDPYKVTSSNTFKKNA